MCTGEPLSGALPVSLQVWIATGGPHTPSTRAIRIRVPFGTVQRHLSLDLAILGGSNRHDMHVAATESIVNTELSQQALDIAAL